MITYKIIIREFLNDRLAMMGLGIIFFLLLTAFFAPYLAPDPNAIFDINPAKRLLAPSRGNPFGTDHMGRDILSRVIFGTRVIHRHPYSRWKCHCHGVPIGLVAGYYESGLAAFL
jgi:peptide/nickel transport system permease protein